MRPFQSIVTLLSLFSMAGPVLALPAFPGAEGWGADTPGGRGPNPAAVPPKVYVVTSVGSNPDTPGTQPHALKSQTGPQFILFRVSGVITMNSSDYFNDGGGRLFDENAYLTIAGQTSPGGITLRSTNGGGRTFWSGAEPEHGHYPFHDGVFRFLRFRGNTVNDDAVRLAHTGHWIMDHCDFSGASDETFDVSYSSHVTIQWCTVANSYGGGDGENRNKGLFIAYQPSSHISVHHSLMAHHNERGGLYTHWGRNLANGYDGYDFERLDNGRIDYRNNVIYNIRECGYFFRLNGQVDEGGVITTFAGQLHLNMVGNYFKAGPNTGQNQDYSCDARPREANGTVHNNTSMLPARLPDQTRAFVHDNYWVPQNDPPQTDVLATYYDHPTLVANAHVMPSVTTLPVQEGYDAVLSQVGAWPRDAMNIRTVNEVRSRTGQFRKIDDPLITAGPLAPADADTDGLPDLWEDALGLDRNSASNNVQVAPGMDGYLWIEVYINDLASARLGEWCRIKDPRSEAAVRQILAAWGETPPTPPSGACPSDPLPPARPRRLRVR